MLKSVLFNNDTHSESAPEESYFSLWVETVIEEHGKFFEVSIEIVDEQTSQELNNTYRHKDKPTNVLSFPLELPECVESELIGDLAICADVVEKEALEQNKPLLNHWAHMTIHGCLHLLGYDHVDEQEAEEMESLEVKLLAKLNIPNPYD